MSRSSQTRVGQAWGTLRAILDAPEAGFIEIWEVTEDDYGRPLKETYDASSVEIVAKWANSIKQRATCRERGFSEAQFIMAKVRPKRGAMECCRQSPAWKAIDGAAAIVVQKNNALAPGSGIEEHREGCSAGCVWRAGVNRRDGSVGPGEAMLLHWTADANG